MGQRCFTQLSLRERGAISVLRHQKVSIRERSQTPPACEAQTREARRRPAERRCDDAPAGTTRPQRTATTPQPAPSLPSQALREPRI